MARKTMDDRVYEPPTETPGPELPGGVVRTIDFGLGVQRPAVLAHLRSIRRHHPTATPAELVRILERRYLAAVTTGGAAVGATAVIPGVGTGITLALSAAETAGFLEATALFAQSVAEVHGIAVADPERARALIMTMMLGREGTDLVRQLAGQATSGRPGRAAYWGELVTNSIPRAVVGPLVDRLKSMFIRRFTVGAGASVISKALPFGVGAVVGGVGNQIFGRRVVAAARLAFGAAPLVLSVELEPAGEVIVVKRPGHLGRAVLRPIRRGASAVGGTVRKALPGGRSSSTDAAPPADEEFPLP
ncbi:hypothetical protein WDJ51_09750 [Rathayibacter sp. YIM 133350]|uniref:hypothetical protein n=1 Tax=Rathayibacter sp. YIM 133350 TaxID=3131992 RepID=UPI00307F7886